MAKGLMAAHMAEPEEATGMAAPAAMPMGTPPATAASMPARGAEEPEPAEDDAGAEEAVEKVMSAAVLALRSPDAKNGLIAAANGGASALADEAYNLTAALDEKSGASIPEAALIPSGLGVLGVMAEVIGADEATVAQASGLMLRRFFVEQGMDPRQADAALQQVDLSAVAASAQQPEA